MEYTGIPMYHVPLYTVYTTAGCIHVEDCVCVLLLLLLLLLVVVGMVAVNVVGVREWCIEVGSRQMLVRRWPLLLYTTSLLALLLESCCTPRCPSPVSVWESGEEVGSGKRRGCGLVSPPLLPGITARLRLEVVGRVLAGGMHTFPHGSGKFEKERMGRERSLQASWPTFLFK